MLILNQRPSAGQVLPSQRDSVTLTYDERKRSRLKVTLASGQAAGIFLARGEHLQHGAQLLAEDGSCLVDVLAAPEKLLEVLATTPLLFARAAYHLGNRHVPVQLLPAADGQGGCLRLQVDHVLADMVRGLGCAVQEINAPFQPEAGAYGAGHHHPPDEAHPGEADLHHPGHGAHRSVPKIHEFRPPSR